MVSAYVDRMVDPFIAETLAGLPAVLVVGPRACGKTTTARRHARTLLRLDRPAESAAVRADPDGALDVPRPVLIDEWQLAPDVLGAVKRAVDDRPGANSFLITGSVRADLNAEGWPLTGRAVRVQMHPLTERELNGDASAAPLLDRLAEDGVKALTLPDHAPVLNEYLDHALLGGFPDAVLAGSPRQAGQWLRAYVDQVVTRDADLLSNGHRDPRRLRRYLHALCLHSADLAEDKTLYDAADINRKTAEAYDRLLDNLLITEATPAWSTNRLKRLVKSPKRYVIDPGIVAAVLRLDRAGVRREADLLGRLLDTYVMTQLRAEVPVSQTDPSLYHLRTEKGTHEIDIIVEYADGKVFGFEVKADSAPTARQARHLTWLRDQLGSRFIGGAILHSGTHIYPLDDRIVAAPICTLWA